jgi:hypothetical protein
VFEGCGVTHTEVLIACLPCEVFTENHSAFIINTAYAMIHQSLSYANTPDCKHVNLASLVTNTFMFHYQNTFVYS